MLNDFEEAEIYALKKLCEVPNKFKIGSTTFDEISGRCKINKSACEFMSGQSPLSQPAVDANGNFISRNYNSLNKKNELWKDYPPEQLTWKRTISGRDGCARSNSLIFNFCEHPKIRLGGKLQNGITDDNLKFEYVVSQGKETCLIPKSYCDKKGVSYSSAENKCVIPIGQKIGEFFGGTTLTRSIRAEDGFIQSEVAKFFTPFEVSESEKKLMGKEVATAVKSTGLLISDKRLKRDINLLKENIIAPGINLYSYYWNDYAVGMFNLPETIQIGFLAQEFPKDMITSRLNGINYINLKSENPLTKFVKLCLKIIKISGISNNGELF